MTLDFFTDTALFNASPAMKLLHTLLISILQGTLLLGLACIVSLLMRRASSAQRRWVWLLALSGMIVLPLASRVVPHRVALIPTRRATQSELPSFQPVGGTFASGAAAFQGTTTDSDTEPTASLVLFPERALPRLWAAWPQGLLYCWLAGVFIFLLRLGIGIRQLRRLERGSTAFNDESWTRELEEAQRQLQIKRPVTLRRARVESTLIVPVTWGWRRPVILLPGSATDWPPSKRRAVLLHEMAHIAHGDWAAFWMAHLVCALYWFHPLVWFASRSLRAESERAADDRVLAAGLHAGDYAEFLVEFVNLLKAARRKSPTLSIGMARSSTLGNRLLALLDTTRSRRRLTRTQIWSGLAATCLCVLVMATIGITDEAVPMPQPPITKGTVTLKGRILDKKGRAVAGAKILVYVDRPDNATPIQTLQSDTEGTYELVLSNTEQSIRFLQIEKPGYGLKVATAYAELAQSPHNWVLPEPTSLTGVIADEDGKPLAGAKIAAVSFTENRYYMGPVHGLETRTDANGRWKLDRLPVGASTDLEASAPGFARQRFPVAIEANSAPFPAMRLQRGFDANGRVLDAEGNPVPHVEVYPTMAGQFTTMTAEDGTFSLLGLTLREQELTVPSPVQGQFAASGVRVSPRRPQVEIRLEKGVTVRGRMLDAKTMSPIPGVRVGSQSRNSNDTDTSDAQGQFEITLPQGQEGSLNFQKSTYQYRYIFLSADQMAQGDAGDILLDRGTIWRGKVRVRGGALSGRVILSLRSSVGTAQIAPDTNGNFQVNSLPPGVYTWAEPWQWQPVAPQQITIPAPQDEPFVQDVNIERLPFVSARGRVVDQHGRSVAYAQVFLRKAKSAQEERNAPPEPDGNGYATMTRADGTWERKNLYFKQGVKIQRVEYQEFAVRNPGGVAKKVGSIWQFPTVVLNTQASQTRVQVVDAKGRKVAGARVAAAWNQELKFALTDAGGNANFKIAPQKVRFMAAKGVEYGKASRDDSRHLASPLPVIIRLRPPGNAVPRAQAVVDTLIDRVTNIPNAEMIGDQRWRAAAMKADKMKVGQGPIDWNQAGKHFGLYLDIMVHSNPAEALSMAPVWLDRIKKPESTHPFFLRLAEAEFAKLAAGSKNRTAKAWANRWLDRQVANFNVRLILSSWSGGDEVSRYLQGYVVAKRLGRAEADRFFAKALQLLPRDQANSGSYGFPEYFTLNDPHAREFRDQLIAEDQVSFQGNLGSASVRENPANGAAATAALEELLNQPGMESVKSETKRFARRVVASEILAAQIKSLRQKNSSETPRSAFEKLKAFDTKEYYMGGFALSLTRRALERGDKALAREVLGFAIAKEWDVFDHQDDWTKLKLQLQPAPPAAQVQLWRAEALANLKNGDLMDSEGRMTDVGADVRRLRYADPAFGRILLETRWARLGALSTNPVQDKRYDGRNLAIAMADYDPARALDWFDHIPGGGPGDATDNKMELAVKIMGAAKPGEH